MHSRSVFLAAFLPFAFAAAGCAPSPHPWNGTLVEPPLEIVDFGLTGAAGEVTKQTLYGRYTALVFGYTHCPDFCPATMSRMAGVMELLGQKAGDLQVALVTVDPERDTPDILADYASSFYPTFIGLTGAPEELAALTNSIGIFSERAHEEGHDTSHTYLVNHTTSIILLDRQADMRMIWSIDLSAEAIASDLERLF